MSWRLLLRQLAVDLLGTTPGARESRKSHSKFSLQYNIGHILDDWKRYSNSLGFPTVQARRLSVVHLTFHQNSTFLYTSILYTVKDV